MPWRSAQANAGAAWVPARGGAAVLAVAAVPAVVAAVVLAARLVLAAARPLEEPRLAVAVVAAGAAARGAVAVPPLGELLLEDRPSVAAAEGVAREGARERVPPSPQPPSSRPTTSPHPSAPTRQPDATRMPLLLRGGRKGGFATVVPGASEVRRQALGGDGGGRGGAGPRRLPCGASLRSRAGKQMRPQPERGQGGLRPRRRDGAAWRRQEPGRGGSRGGAAAPAGCASLPGAVPRGRGRRSEPPPG